MIQYISIIGNMNFYFRFALICLFFVGIYTQEQLIMIQELFRHGARHATRNDFNQEPKYLLGELTNVGLRMHYLLGKKLYEEYWRRLGLLNEIDSSMFQVISTEYNRTIESVQAQLYGLFSHIKNEEINQLEGNLPHWKIKNLTIEKTQLFDNDTNFHNIPIHMTIRNKDMKVNAEIDPLLFHDQCIKNQEWKSDNEIESPYQTKLESIIKKYCKIIKDEYKYKEKCSLRTVRRFASVHLSNISMGEYTNPMFEERQNFDQLMYAYLQAILIPFCSDRQQIQIVNSPILILIRKNLRNKIYNNSTQKMILLSAHDLTLINVLAVFNMTSPQCVETKYFVNRTLQNCISQVPRFASNLIIQLSKKDAAYYIKMRYNGIYQKMSFCNYQNSCLYERFESFLNKTIVQNYQQLCGNTQYFQKMIQPKVTKIQPITENADSLQQALILMLITLFLYVMYKIVGFVQNSEPQKQMISTEQSADVVQMKPIQPLPVQAIIETKETAQNVV